MRKNAGIRKAEERINEKGNCSWSQEKQKDFQSKNRLAVKTALHEVACVKEACKETGQKIKEKAGMRKAEERLKERETGVAVEKRMENFCMQRIYKMRLNREEQGCSCQKA